MNKIGRRIYFDVITGNIILNTGERQGSVSPTTIDQDIATFTALNERARETYDVIELSFGSYSQDFAECDGYRINVETLEIEFSYPDPNTPEAEPVYQIPLSEQIEGLKTQLQMTQEAIDFLLMGGM